MTFKRDDGDLYYFILNWTTTTYKSVQVVEKFKEDAEVRTVFIGALRELTGGPTTLNRYQGYVAG